MNLSTLKLPPKVEAAVLDAYQTGSFRQAARRAGVLVVAVVYRYERAITLLREAGHRSEAAAMRNRMSFSTSTGSNSRS